MAKAKRRNLTLTEDEELAVCEFLTFYKLGKDSEATSSEVSEAANRVSRLTKDIGYAFASLEVLGC